MNKKPFYKKVWFWLIIVGIIIVAFIINLLLSCLYPNCGSNIFTTISGWVSGFATLLVGLIASWQVYENDKATKKQSLYNQIMTFLNDLEISYIDFVQPDKILDISYDLQRMGAISDEKQWLIKAESIYSSLLDLAKSLVKFEAVLKRSCYCSDKAIELHKLIVRLVKRVNLDIPQSERLKNCQKLAEEILSYMRNIDLLASGMMVEYHELQLNLLKDVHIKKLFAKVEKEQQAIIDYFKKDAEGQNNG